MSPMKTGEAINPLEVARLAERDLLPKDVLRCQWFLRRSHKAAVWTTKTAAEARSGYETSATVSSKAQEPRRECSPRQRAA